MKQGCQIFKMENLVFFNQKIVSTMFKARKLNSFSTCSFFFPEIQVHLTIQNKIKKKTSITITKYVLWMLFLIFFI